MEEQKYFTPNVEDFHKGYEYEILELHRENYHVGFNNIISKWIPKKWDSSQIRLNKLACKITSKEIRVPYLTKKQIEAEGWKVENFPYNIIKGVKNTGIYDLNDDMTGIEYNLFYRFENKRLSIESYIINYGKADRPYKGVNCIYFGECKDINTFRYICKLLEI